MQEKQDTRRKIVQVHTSSLGHTDLRTTKKEKNKEVDVIDEKQREGKETTRFCREIRHDIYFLI